MVNFITGLGGRDVSIKECIRMFGIATKAQDTEKMDDFVTWIGIRE